jgi:nitrite reductase/ring-hydroxylating ferredoxin subunit
MMICGTVQCPWHGSQFNVVSGDVVSGPAEERIDVYRVEETAAGVKLFLS